MAAVAGGLETRKVADAIAPVRRIVAARRIVVARERIGARFVRGSGITTGSTAAAGGDRPVYARSADQVCEEASELRTPSGKASNRGLGCLHPRRERRHNDRRT